jgi:hypothetical protein
LGGKEPVSSDWVMIPLIDKYNTNKIINPINKRNRNFNDFGNSLFVLTSFLCIK